MSSINIPGSDQGANQKFQTFKTGAAANATALGLTAPQIEQISEAADDFSAKYDEAIAAKDAAKGAVSDKDKARSTATTVVRTFAQIVKNAPGATPTILAACGLTPNPTPSGALAPVTGLSATGAANGTAEITWNRNGNAKGTNFVIQYTLSPGGPWNWLGNTTKARFTDGGAAPGVFKMYRVLSQKAGATSAPSNEAVIYGDGGEEGLSIAA